MLLAVVPVANTLVHPIGKKVPSGTFKNILAPKTPVVDALLLSPLYQGITAMLPPVPMYNEPTVFGVLNSSVIDTVSLGVTLTTFFPIKLNIILFLN
jgi:hypothetical protein